MPVEQEPPTSSAPTIFLPYVPSNWRMSSDSPRSNPDAIFAIALRFHVLIMFGCTPYFLDSSASVISSRIASSATLALKSSEWFFLFAILNRLFRHAINLNDGSEFPRLFLITPIIN
jgi:hypothetical protein